MSSKVVTEVVLVNDSDEWFDKMVEIIERKKLFGLMLDGDSIFPHPNQEITLLIRDKAVTRARRFLIALEQSDREEGFFIFRAR